MSEDVKQKKSAKQIERVTIEEDLRETLAAWVDQANASMQGVASVGKGDVVNMILRRHTDVLSEEEIGCLRAEHVDQVKLALWLASAAKSARREGKDVSLRDLLDRCDSMMAARKPRAPTRTRKVRQSEPASSSPPEALPTE